MKTYSRRPEIAGGYHHSLMPGTKLWLTCGNCQLVCHPDKDERRKRHRALRESGVVIQHPDGTLEAVPPEAASSHIENMPAATRSLYVDDS